MPDVSNRRRIEVLLEAVEKALQPYVSAKMEDGFGKNWRDYGRVPKALTPKAEIDAYACLFIIVNNWHDTFKQHLKPSARDAASAALAGRNAFSHSVAELDDQTTLRALSGGAELLELVGEKAQAKTVRAQFDQLQQEMVLSKLRAQGKLPSEPNKGEGRTGVSNEGPKSVSKSGDQAEQASLLGGGDVEGLKPWRIVMPPREDVLTGRLNKDSFAANLAVADRGYRDQNSDSTYADPIAFFESTHPTHGLKLVLEQAGKRFVGGDAPAVIGLQTNFGGGKTHTLLSLLHMANLRDLAKSQVLSGVQETIGTGTLPEVRTVVFSGVDKGPDHPLEIVEGKSIRTLWGYVAWHLAGREGLELIRTSEEAGTSPGAEAIQKILELSGRPSLILLDELVAFVRQLNGERFEAHLSFIQALTEAASQVPNALVVGSLPESDVEAGQEQGKEALRRLEKVFGRTQSAWEPAQGTETYAVVRRRLFQDLDETGEKERKRTVDQFRKMYRDNKGDFPAYTGERDYLDKMTEAYPVHPMLFDVLAGEWGPLDKFQRTRGVLSLIAKAVFADFRYGTNDPILLPGSLKINDPSVKGALIEPLEGPAWSAIADNEIDGDTSVTVIMESVRKRYRDVAAARRAARSVFLATAPRDGTKGGITGSELRLACARPGEQLSIFVDALRELEDRSAHLYEAEGQYWYGPKPTLGKLAQQREADIDPDRVDQVIEDMLRQEVRPKGGWSRVHAVPDHAYEVADERSCALVILGPKFPYDDSGSSPAHAELRDGLNRRAGGQRRYRNALVYALADQKAIEETRRLVRRAIAWQEVATDELLDLTASQLKDAQTRSERSEKVAREQLRKAWVHLMVPGPDPHNSAEVTLEHTTRRQAGGKTISEHAWELVLNGGIVVDKLGPTTLGNKIKTLWPKDSDSLPVDMVRDWYFEYLHMERVRDEQVVADALSDAAADLNAPPFAIAESGGEDGYGQIFLSKTQRVAFGSGMTLLTPAVAKEELVRRGDAQPTGGGLEGGASVPPGDEGGPRESQTPLRFTGVISLDPIKGAMKVNQVFGDVIAELDRVPNAEITITVEIQAKAPDGYPDDVIDVVTDNAGVLGFDVKKFE